jgi:hypothetical protein
MISKAINRGTRVRLLLSGFLGIGVLAVEQVLPGRLSDEARELSWLSASRDKLADSTSEELARWQQRAMSAGGATLSDWQAALGPQWDWEEQGQRSFRLSASTSFAYGWAEVLESLQQLEALPGVIVEQVEVSTSRGGRPALYIEVTVRRLNEE